MHDLYLGTFLNTDCGTVAVSVDGVVTTHDLYLNEFGGTTANLKVRGNVAAGNHTVEITATYAKNAASSGYYFYFDYLWPLEPQDVPDAPQQLSDVSLAMDFDTDHGYKKPPAWHLWHLQKLGFKGHADVYMGVFWNNKRRRISATYPYATVVFSGTPAAGDVVSFSIGGHHGQSRHRVRRDAAGDRLRHARDHQRAVLRRVGRRQLRIEHDAAHPIEGAMLDVHRRRGERAELRDADAHGPPRRGGRRGRLGNDRRRLAGDDRGRAEVDSRSRRPVPGGGHQGVLRVLDGVLPPSGRDARQVSALPGGVVSPGADVDLGVPSHQMHFGTRVRTYLRQMYKECADQIEAAGLPVVLQFGETQWWYFDNRRRTRSGGMPYYDQDTISDFAAAKGHQIWPFRANTDDPAGDPAHPNETADFLRDRIWAYCQDVITYVRAYHPTAVFECLWPLDANQGTPKPSRVPRLLTSM